MPPEPLPWDRKDFLRDKRLDTVGSVSRWRDSPRPSREFLRWSSDDFRRTPGYGKPGGYHIFSEESVHGSTTSRMLGEESNFRKYARYNSRESRGSWKGSSWEANGDASAQQPDASAKRSVSDLLTYSSHPHSDIENSSWDNRHRGDKIPAATVNAGLSMGYRHDRDQPLAPVGWKNFKWNQWNRSGSLSSRGSGFSHTSSSKSGGADSDEVKPDSQSGRVSPLQSPSGEPAAPAGSTSPFEDMCPRKKPRLGWGQGLAKYEKGKVEGSDETVCKNGLLACVNNKVTPPLETNIPPTLPDKSPRITGLSECASPATTSSVACSSSPGCEDKLIVKAANNDIDTCNLSASPSHGFQSCLEEFSIDLEHLELTSVTNLNSLLCDLLQFEDTSSGDSNFAKSTTMNKLLLLKCEFSKALEKTESEIDLFENELKLLKSESETNDSYLVASKSSQLECISEFQEELGAASMSFQKPVPLQLASSNDMLEDIHGLCSGALEGDKDEVKNDDIDSPGTATSKFIEPLSIAKTVSVSSSGKPDICSSDVVAPGSPSDKCVLFSVIEKRTGYVSGSGDGKQQLEISTGTHVPSYPSNSRNEECNLHDLIVHSNRELAKNSFEELSKLLPADQPEIDIWGSCSTSWLQNKSFVKEKLATRKCSQRFKEKVLTIKFRALQQLWKEEHLLSIKKYKAKSHKRIEFTSRGSHSGSQKHRSSTRFRINSPGIMNLVPTTEIVDFTSQLLSGSQITLQRNSLKMPALLLDEKEKRLSRFVTSNGLVEDPCAVEKERMVINPWMPKEKETFLEMLATFGKDFKKIASYLDHKTTADCVEFYYKNHKSESFQKMKKSDPMKQEKSLATSTYLVTSGKKWNRDVNAASLDLLGAASMIAANADDRLKSRQTTVSRSFVGGSHHDYKTCWGDDGSYEKSSSVDALGNDRETAAADTLAGICGALSSEAMSSCVTSSVDPGEGFQEFKLQKKRKGRLLIPKAMQVIDDEETCSDESFEEFDNLDWTDEEKSKFIGALRSYGKDFLKISRCVRTRSMTQCKIFFCKTQRFLGLDMMHLGSGNEGTPVSDANGGRSDTDDACVLELESAICSTQSCSKMDVDLPLSSMDTNCETLENAGTDCLQIEPDRSKEHDCKEQLNPDDAEASMEDPILDDGHAGVEPDFVSHGEGVTLKGVGECDATPDNSLLGDTVTADAGLNCDGPVVCTEKSYLNSGNEAEELQRTDQIVSPSENCVRSQSLGLLARCTSIDTVEPKVVRGPADGLMAKSGQQQLLVAESKYDCSHNVKIGVDTSSSRSSSVCLVHDSIKTPRQVSEVNPNLSLTTKHQSEDPRQLLSSDQKAHTMSWKQKENGCSVTHCEDHHQQATSSSIHFEETANKQHQRPLNADVYQQYLSCQQSLNHQADQSQILRGYPLQVLNKKDLNGRMDTISSENHSILPNFSKASMNFQSNPFLVENTPHEKCSGLKPALSMELPFLSHNHEQSSGYRSRSHSQGSSDTEEHSRKSGDFKLFGQILNPSTSSASTTHETEQRGKLSSKVDLKFGTDHVTDRGLIKSKFDPSKYSSSVDFPLRSYGFWDGNRIQTGLSSLPDSAILLAKYPGAFGEYPASSSCGDQHSLPAVIKRNDRNLGCVSVYPSMDVNVNGSLPDYQVYRSYDVVKAQPFLVDVKRHDALCELQKRNGLDVSGFQQQERAVMGVNVMGSGILVGGGGCTGVSDPVAAIKMHYATTGRNGGQSGSLREDDSWRGDIGR